MIERQDDQIKVEKYLMEQLWTRVPEIKLLKGELKAKLDKLLAVEADADTIYGILSEYFLLLMKNYSNNASIIKKISHFIEDLLHNDSVHVQHVAVMVIDDLVRSCNALNILEEWLLPKSLEVARSNSIFSFLYKYAFEELFRRVPEIERLEGELGEYVDDIKRNCLGPYIIYESVLVPYLIQLIKNPTAQNKAIINRILQLIEDFSQHENEDIRNLISVGVMETLLDKLDPVSDVEKWLLPNSLKIAREVGSSMFGFDYRNGWKKRGL